MTETIEHHGDCQWSAWSETWVCHPACGVLAAEQSKFPSYADLQAQLAAKDAELAQVRAERDTVRAIGHPVMFRIPKELWGQRGRIKFESATHPTDTESGTCPECYSKGFEDAESDLQQQLTAAEERVKSAEAILQGEVDCANCGMDLYAAHHRPGSDCIFTPALTPTVSNEEVT